MTDDLKRMQEAFRQECPIVPDEKVKRIAISRAMAALIKLWFSGHDSVSVIMGGADCIFRYR